MAARISDRVYSATEIVGTSEASVDDAADMVREPSKGSANTFRVVYVDPESTTAISAHYE
jgi:flavin-binding protein dodecin